MTSTQKILAALAGVGAIVVVAFVFSKDEPKKTPSTTTTTTLTTTDTPPTLTVAPSTAATQPATSKPAVVTSGAPVDMATLAQEAKQVESARAALQAGDPKKALAELERYEKIPQGGSLKQEIALIKIEALAKSGRRTDALALAMSTRDDPSFAPYKDRVDAVLADAGLIGPAPVTTVP